MKVTLLPVFSLVRSMVEFPGTVMPSRTMLVQDATAAGMPEYAVTWQASDGVLVAVGVVDVGELVTMLTAAVDDAGFEETAAVVEDTAVVGTAVGFPPLRQVQALEIFAGTLDQRAAYAGKVWVGAFV